MPANRFFLPQPLLPSASPMPLYLKEEEYHHLRVLRVRTGDIIEVVNGQGELIEAKVTQIDSTSAMLHTTSYRRTEPQNQELILCYAISKPSSLEWVMEKGTELGVTQFWIFPATLSPQPTVSEKQQHRLRTIVKSSLKQCGRLFLPSIQIKPSLHAWDPVEGCLLVGDPQATKPLSAPLPRKIIVCIGPEKGFSKSELEQLHVLKAQFISLHNDVLRTETAAIVAVAQIDLLTRR